MSSSESSLRLCLALSKLSREDLMEVEAKAVELSGVHAGEVSRKIDDLGRKVDALPSQRDLWVALVSTSFVILLSIAGLITFNAGSRLPDETGDIESSWSDIDKRIDQIIDSMNGEKIDADR